MVRNPHLLRRFEDDQARMSPPDLARNLKLLDAMYQHARNLGAWKHDSEIPTYKLNLARALNV